MASEKCPDIRSIVFFRVLSSSWEEKAAIHLPKQWQQALQAIPYPDAHNAQKNLQAKTSSNLNK